MHLLLFYFLTDAMWAGRYQVKRSSVLGCQQLKSNGEAPVVVGEPVPRERSRVAFGGGQRGRRGVTEQGRERCRPARTVTLSCVKTTRGKPASAPLGQAVTAPYKITLQLKNAFLLLQEAPFANSLQECLTTCTHIDWERQRNKQKLYLTFS